jgi:hypothetical protein
MRFPRQRFLALAFAAVTGPFAAAPCAALEDVDPDQVFQGFLAGEAGRSFTEAMAGDRRIAVPVFRVGFVIDSSATAEVLAARLPGRNMAGAHSSLRVALQGVDEATMQQITDAAYQLLLDQLRESGREVVPTRLLERYWASFKAVSPPGRPYTRTHKGRTAVFFAPAGMPIVLTHFERAWDDPTVRDLSNYRKLLDISSEVNAAVISPIAFVDFAKLRTSGMQSGRFAQLAETGADLAMSVAALSSVYVRGRAGPGPAAVEGSFQMKQALASPMRFGSMSVMSRQVNGAYDLPGSAPLNAVLATGGNRTSTHAAAQTTNEEYSAAARDAIGRMTIALGNWFRRHRPADAVVEGLRLRMSMTLASLQVGATPPGSPPSQ